jgi:chromate transporter
VTPPPSLSQAVRVWFKIGCLGFGGPAGQIALMHREVVETRGWIDEAGFQQALSFCMLLPGPEAQQLATYLGWRMHGVRGGLVAGLLFILPGLLIVTAVSGLYVAYGQFPATAAALLGIKAAVAALVLQALIRIGRRNLNRPLTQAIAVLSLLAMSLLSAPFAVVILAAGMAGALFMPRGAKDAEPLAPSVPGLLGQSVRTALVWAAIWLVPVFVVAILLPASTLARVGLLFSQLAVVSFGGAYAVLAYVGPAATSLGWLTPGQMLDGLGLAETTPGPLILVLVFVAFVGTYQTMAGEGGAGLWAVAAAIMAAWAVFAPSFLWIFVGAPWMERLSRVRWLTAALTGVSAAVVGVIANLALWFCLHLLFTRQAAWPVGPLRMDVPDLSSLSFPALGLVVLGLALTFWARTGVLRLIFLMAVAGYALHLFRMCE